MLELFEKYLRKDSKSENTIKSSLRHLNLYLNWFKESFETISLNYIEKIF
jgi:hypothetical protein